MGFNIRFACESDVSTIQMFVRELLDYEHLLDGFVATEELLREGLFEKKMAEVLIGEVDGEPVGFALFFHNFSSMLGLPGIFLEDLYVLPHARGNGFGKALLKRLAELAVERGCGRLEWGCLNWNEPSIGFYLSLGAQPKKEWTAYRLTGDALKGLAKR